MNNWDKIAIEYNNQVGEEGDFYHQIYLNPKMLKLLGKIKGKKILDLACGNGYFTNLLLQKGAKVIGIDSSDELINIAKNKFGDHFIISDSTNIPLKERFDLIISNIALHDIENYEGTINECVRLLKNEGELLFSIPHAVFGIAKRGKKVNVYYKEITQYLTNFEAPHGVYQGVTYFHRPIGYYLKILFNNGFCITDFEEIATKHSQGKLIEDKELLKHKSEIPTFLIIKAKLK